MQQNNTMSIYVQGVNWGGREMERRELKGGGPSYYKQYRSFQLLKKI